LEPTQPLEVVCLPVEVAITILNAQLNVVNPEGPNITTRHIGNPYRHFGMCQSPSPFGNPDFSIWELTLGDGNQPGCVLSPPIPL
jgi:hypothetical protein